MLQWGNDHHRRLARALCFVECATTESGVSFKVPSVHFEALLQATGQDSPLSQTSTPKCGEDGRRLNHAEPGFSPENERQVAEMDEFLAKGSKSFNAAATLLPRSLRIPTSVLYAFCRKGDDAVDEDVDIDDPNAEVCAEKRFNPDLQTVSSEQSLKLRTRNLAKLRQRLDRIYSADMEAKNILDSATRWVVRSYQIPKGLPEALYEGFEWDLQGKHYDTMEDLQAYCARVAGTVGCMMTLMMGRRKPEVLARACDLGVAMQLTNICRDVGEDARSGRVYLPLLWLRQENIDVDDFLRKPTLSAGLVRVIDRVLLVADGLYHRADAGIDHLPPDCQLAIKVASRTYHRIGMQLKAAGCDSISTRHHVSKIRKVAIAIGCAFDVYLLAPAHRFVYFLFMPRLYCSGCRGACQVSTTHPRIMDLPALHANQCLVDSSSYDHDGQPIASPAVAWPKRAAQSPNLLGMGAMLLLGTIICVKIRR